MAKKVSINKLKDPFLIGECSLNAPKEIIEFGTRYFSKYALVKKEDRIEKYIESSEVDAVK